MHSIPIASNECNKCAVLEAENQRLKAENLALKRQLGQYKQFIRWEDSLFSLPSDILSDGEKIVARWVPELERQARQRMTTDDERNDGFLRIYPANVAEKTGKSKDRVGAALKKLDSIGMIDYKTSREYDREKEQVQTLSLLGGIDNLKKLIVEKAPERNRGNGQKHFICKACHSQDVVVKQLPVYEVICKACGERHEYDERKIEDKAFIVSASVAASWGEHYPDPLEEPQLDTSEPQPLAPERECIKCGKRNWIWDYQFNNWRCIGFPHDDEDIAFLERALNE